MTNVCHQNSNIKVQTNVKNFKDKYCVSFQQNSVLTPLIIMTYTYKCMKRDV